MTVEQIICCVIIVLIILVVFLGWFLTKNDGDPGAYHFMNYFDAPIAAPTAVPFIIIIEEKRSNLNQSKTNTNSKQS